MDTSSGGLSPEAATDVASKLEGVAAAAAEEGKQREALSLCLHAHSLMVCIYVEAGVLGVGGSCRRPCMPVDRCLRVPDQMA